MPTDEIEMYRGVKIYLDVERSADGASQWSYRCFVNGILLVANTLETMKRRIDAKLDPH